MTQESSPGRTARRSCSSTMPVGGLKNVNGQWIRCRSLSTGFCFLTRMRFSHQIWQTRSQRQSMIRILTAITLPCRYIFLGGDYNTAAQAFGSYHYFAKDLGVLNAAFRIKTPVWPTWKCTNML